MTSSQTAKFYIICDTKNINRKQGKKQGKKYFMNTKLSQLSQPWPASSCFRKGLETKGGKGQDRTKQNQHCFMKLSI